jgi:hypothetical protein
MAQLQQLRAAGVGFNDIEVVHLCHNDKCYRSTHLWIERKAHHKIRDQTCQGSCLAHLPQHNCQGGGQQCRNAAHFFNPCLHIPQCVLPLPIQGQHYV